MVKLDELKDLPPEEKLKKLKELEEERKKEITEAESQIKEAEKQMKAATDELEEKEEMLRKIPVPELEAANIEGMFKAEENLEGTVEAEAPPPPEEEEAHRQYIQQLSMTPMEQLDQKVDYLRNMNEQFGKLTDEQYDDAVNMQYALAEKQEATNAGTYDASGRTKDDLSSRKNWLDDLLGTYKGAP